MYITYAEYQANGGKLTETAFDLNIKEAQAKIDYYTFGRLKNDTAISENVKLVLVKIIDMLNSFNSYQSMVTDTTAPIVSTASNDGVSISYGGYMGNTTPQNMADISKNSEAEIYKIIKLYLGGETNAQGQSLLYRGVC